VCTRSIKNNTGNIVYTTTVQRLSCGSNKNMLIKKKKKSQALSPYILPHLEYGKKIKIEYFRSNYLPILVEQG